MRSGRAPVVGAAAVGDAASACVIDFADDPNRDHVAVGTSLYSAHCQCKCLFRSDKAQLPLQEHF